MGAGCSVDNWRLVAELREDPAMRVPFQAIIHEGKSHRCLCVPVIDDDKRSKKALCITGIPEEPDK